MTLLIDENLPQALVGWLAQHKIESIHVCELGLDGQADEAIARHAVNNGLCILTKDKDFDQLIRSAPGLKAIRLTAGNMRTQNLLDWLEGRLGELHAAIASESSLSTL